MIPRVSLLPTTPLRACLTSLLLVVCSAAALSNPASPVPASAVKACDGHSGWIAVGDADCILIGKSAMNLTNAQNYCLSLGNGSKLVILRNYRFNQRLIQTLNATLAVNASSAKSTDPAAAAAAAATPLLQYWTGTYVDRWLRLNWLNSTYSDLSMSPLPGGSNTAIPRHIGKFGALNFYQAATMLKFLEPSEPAPFPLCASQTMESPLRPAIPFDSKLRCPGDNATLHRGLCYRLLNSPSVMANAHKWNRTNALSACIAWAPNATLATVNDLNTEFLVKAMISSMAKGHVWIGLEYETKGGYWAWPTSEAKASEDMRHSNWKFNEPNARGRDACVVAHQREVNLGEWNDVPCSHPFSSALCQVEPIASSASSPKPPPPPLSPPSFTPTPIGIAESSRCRAGFYEYGQACWMLGGTQAAASLANTNTNAAKITSSNNISGSRYDIAAKCSELNASLAFFHHRGEQAFLSALAEQLGSLSGSVWLGLNLSHDVGNDAWRLSWDDGSGADYDFVWKQLPSHLKSTVVNDRLCTSLALATNSFEARLCNDTGVSIACRYNLVDHPLSPDKSRDLTCPDGSDTAVGGKCYRLSPTKALANWSTASLACEMMNGSLASVHNREEQTVLNKLLLALSKDAWIGMTVRDTAEADLLMQPVWSDESPVDFYQFRHGYPKALMPGAGTVCVRIAKQYGEWVTGNCNDSLPYVCQVPGIPVTTAAPKAATTPAASIPVTTKATSSAAPSTAVPGAAATSPPPGCQATHQANASLETPDGAGCYDYAYSLVNKTWQAADAWCRQQSPGNWTLASVSSRREGDFLTRLLKRMSPKQTNSPVWIGGSTRLSWVANAFTQWADGSPMVYVNFAPSDTVDLATRLPPSSCTAVILSEEHNTGAWLAEDCNKPLPFLCKRTRLLGSAAGKSPAAAAGKSPAAAVAVPSTSTKTYACPADWVNAASDDPACYRVLDAAVPYDMASKACIKVGAKLASYQTQRQLQRMASLLADRGGDSDSGGSAWIGLSYTNKTAEGGVYAWEDGKPVSSTDWATDSAAQL